KRLDCRAGVVRAERVRCHRVAGRSERTRAGAAAYRAELAPSALAGQRVRISQHREDLVRAIHVSERSRPYIAAWHRQKTAGADGAQMIDEHKTVAVVHAAGRAQLPAPLDRV